MTWPVASGSLLLGFAIAQATGIRPLGGIVLIAGCAWCALRWLRIRPGAYARTAVLVVVYIGAFVLSHVVADSLGAWPSVLLAAAVTGLAVYALADSAGDRSTLEPGDTLSPGRARP
ncbi:MAG TPA: hypothetical protein VNA28_15580 [Solirubrobacteraceae bacterium]|nr:hypothetical protein [Solirubrobacteraceae bacterium]